MAFRFQKRIRIAPGIRVNLSRSGISGTFGVPGASVNVGKDGVHRNLGLPGTGLSTRTRIGGKAKGAVEEPAGQPAEPPAKGRGGAAHVLLGLSLTFLMIAIALAALATPAAAHGGGCRKSSPPGQCCHLETATGRVHCH